MNANPQHNMYASFSGVHLPMCSDIAACYSIAHHFIHWPRQLQYNHTICASASANKSVGGHHSASSNHGNDHMLTAPGNVFTSNGDHQASLTGVLENRGSSPSRSSPFSRSFFAETVDWDDHEAEPKAQVLAEIGNGSMNLEVVRGDKSSDANDTQFC
eukprot:29767-Amphidinium_carterae.1